MKHLCVLIKHEDTKAQSFFSRLCVFVSLCSKIVFV